MSYCVTADVKETGGVYLNKNVPAVSNLDFTEMIERAYYEINENLYRSGIVVPVSNTLLHASARLKALNCWGALAQTEGALRSRGNPGGKSIEEMSGYYKKLFDDRLKAICDFPKSLFAEEDEADLADAFTSKLLVRPMDEMFYCANYANDDTTPTFEVDDQY